MRFIHLLLVCVTLPPQLALLPKTAEAQLRGHGGPVRALAVSSDGTEALSGSFDTSAIRWSLRTGTAGQVLRAHDGAVNAVAFAGKGGRNVTAGQDARIVIWTPGRQTPDTVLEGHKAPVAGLAVSPDGSMLASASWDSTIRLWPLAGGQSRVLEGHQQNVNAVAFAPDNKAVISAGYDATVRIWPLEPQGPPIVAALAAPLNALAVAPDGEIVAAGADGKVYFLSSSGKPLASIAATSSPIVALSLSSDGERIAAASIGGPIALIRRKSRLVERSLLGPSLPAWSIAFLPDGKTLLAGGTDGIIRRWDLESGKPAGVIAYGGRDDPLAAYAGDRGAEVFRGCVACHDLKAGGGNRAGPSLHGVFGRHIASLPGYNYSEALKHLDIVWTPETLAKLFEIGPAKYTPGTKMPEQHVGPEDREALIKFLQHATK
jgi:cytochrome c